MVTGCGCVDPLVFGHGRACELDLGPSTSGGELSPGTLSPSAHSQKYERPAETESVRRWYDRVVEWSVRFDRRYSELQRAHMELYGRPF